jgi:hypothetical protein
MAVELGMQGINFIRLKLHDDLFEFLGGSLERIFIRERFETEKIRFFDP